MLLVNHVARRYISRPLNLMQWRCLSTTPTLAAKPLPPRPKINEADIEENFLKGSGPGGQKINKTASAVQLLHKPTGIVMKSQATRSRIQNRKIARQLLAEKLEVMEKGGESRKSIKDGKASKKKRSREKKARRKYRKLAEGKEGDGEEEGNDEDEDEDDEEDGQDNEAGTELAGRPKGVIKVGDNTDSLNTQSKG